MSTDRENSMIILGDCSKNICSSNIDLIEGIGYMVKTIIVLNDFTER